MENKNRVHCKDCVFKRTQGNMMYCSRIGKSVQVLPGDYCKKGRKLSTDPNGIA